MSPIKGLTDRGAAFPEIGRIRKGGPKPASGNRPGKDLEYFRVEFDDFEHETAAEFSKLYGEKPRLLRIVLPLPTSIDHDGQVINPNWEAWREAYLAGGMIHRCDGERVWFHIDPMTSKHEVRNGEPYTECANAKSTNGSIPIGYYQNAKGKETPVYCEPVGRLKVILPELQRFAYLTLLTGSFYDIVNLSQQMNGYVQVHDNLQGIPFIVQRKPMEIPAPIGEDGRKVRVTKWMLSIETDPDWVKAKLESMRVAAYPQQPLEGEERNTLPAPEADIEEGQFESIDESSTSAASPRERPETTPEQAEAFSEFRTLAMTDPGKVGHNEFWTVVKHYGIEVEEGLAIKKESGSWADGLIYVLDKFSELDEPIEVEV